MAPVRVRSYLTSPAATTRRGRRRSQGWSGCAPTAHHERATGVLKGSPSRRGCGRKTCRTVLVRSSPRRHGSFPNRPPRATRATAPGPARTGDGGRADARAEDFGGGYGPSDEGRVSTETRHEGCPSSRAPYIPPGARPEDPSGAQRPLAHPGASGGSEVPERREGTRGRSPANVAPGSAWPEGASALQAVRMPGVVHGCGQRDQLVPVDERRDEGCQCGCGA